MGRLSRRRAGFERRHWLFAAVLLACAAAWSANLLLGEVRPGNDWALGYGVAALALLLVAASYGVRRRLMSLASRKRAGSSSAWLAVHVYGGVLFLLLVLMHSGFGLPSGWVTWWLWGLSWWVVLVGLGGLFLQRWIPRLLTSGLTVEAHYDRIPELIEGVRERAEKVAAESSPEVRDLYRRVVAPQLAGPRRRALYYVDITGGIQIHLREFTHLFRLLGDEEQRHLREILRLMRTTLELDAHYTLQQPLRWWLYLHLPASMLLLVFVVLHLLAVLLY